MVCGISGPQGRFRRGGSGRRPDGDWSDWPNYIDFTATATVCQPLVVRFHRNNSSNPRMAIRAASDGSLATSRINLLPRAIHHAPVEIEKGKAGSVRRFDAKAGPLQQSPQCFRVIVPAMANVPVERRYWSTWYGHDQPASSRHPGL